MKAAAITAYEAPIEIMDVPTPQIQDDTSVLIQVHAASLNPIDSILRTGQMDALVPLTFPHVMGYDVSGTVIEVGDSVQGVQVGDAVVARPRHEDGGAVAEVARLHVDDLAHKPAEIDHPTAASIPLAGLTAWQGLVTKGHLKHGDKVLIHAGSGGVGTFAIQIAKHFGAYVATTTSAQNADLVKGLGADEVIDYKTQDFAELLSDYDLVLDAMGGEVLKRSFAVLKKGGRLVSIKGEDSEGQAEQAGVHFESFFMTPNGPMLTELVRLVADGTITPVIDSVYPMEQAAQAYAHLNTGHAAGKIVVTI